MQGAVRVGCFGVDMGELPEPSPWLIGCGSRRALSWAASIVISGQRAAGGEDDIRAEMEKALAEQGLFL
ncbi:hypothetical protein QU481_02680 [Crenobacter sp. SG2303]|uniref:Uncharacterized protein n=1 Tax=Crenobacter oryzisoli TaxID=3056844 RepID=A0ABT7XJ49_9NEIS|nr:hypothetical protein [Crenobacter sp. SG2303]MDN0073796.1 hypothetical protein [Crenobacter sp. SG2303]